MRWQILGKISSSKPASRRAELEKILLVNRDLKTDSQKEAFFSPPAPADLSLRALGINSAQMKKALVRLKKAITAHESIVVYGDYDADGICGTAVLWETLFELGAKAVPYLPDRTTEGYGLNDTVLARLKKEDPDLKLIVTVDQGIVAHRQVKTAHRLGIEVIITDHHQPAATPPDALAIIHTTKIAGVSVAWVLAYQLAKLFKKNLVSVNHKLELAAIGTVTDLLPLTGLNRSFVINGLSFLHQTQRPGLLSLCRQVNLPPPEIGAYEIGFIIGPRLNATGRVEEVIDSLRLLCTHSLRRAGLLAAKLERANRLRQQLTETVFQKAREKWLAQQTKTDKLIFVDGEDWEEGVIGLAASSLAKEFYLPAIVLSRKQETAKASARSIEGFNIFEAIQSARDLLLDAGGHPLAAGFSVETKNLPELKEKLLSLAEQKLDDRLLEKQLKVDAELNLEDLDFSLFSWIEKMSPFGISNPQPDFVSRGLKLLDAHFLGKEQRHLKLRVASPLSKKIFTVVAFGFGDLYSRLSPETKLDLVYDLQLDTWGGKHELQLRAKDLKII